MSIGRFDIQTAVMTLSSFHAAQRKRHLDRVKRIYAFIFKMKHAVISIRTGEPEFSGLPNLEFDWEKSIYGIVREINPKYNPKPLRKYVTCTHYIDANLMIFFLTGRSVTGI